MGQRSEIYVGYETKSGKKGIAARYFGWNYADRMISRVAYTAKWLESRIEYPFYKNDLISIIETNFDMIDHIQSEDLIGEGIKLSISTDSWLDDGRAFLFVNGEGKIKYCFADNHHLNPLDCNGYMMFDTEQCYPEYQWKNETYRNSEEMDKCRNNIKWLSQNASVMTQEELDEFIETKWK